MIHKIKKKLFNVFTLVKYPILFRLNIPVFIYQMGKVGSSSISTSLRKQYNGAIIHGHGFSRDNYSPHVRYLYKYYSKKSQTSLKIITTVREPIGRNVSSFFQNFKRTTGKEFKKAEHSVLDLKEIFLKKFPHQTPLKWMDNFDKNFGIDVYESPFPNSGIKTYTNHKGVDLLIMRHDVSDKLKEIAIKEFLNLKKFELKTYNVGGNKVYGEIYESFRKQIRFDKDYINQYRNSKYFNHFYPKEYVDSICDKWSEKK